MTFTSDYIMWTFADCYYIVTTAAGYWIEEN
jgi:hypothetical protein